MNMPLLLAPRSLWGCSRALLALLLVGLGAQSVHAQAGSAADAKKGGSPKGAAKADETKSDEARTTPVLPATVEEQEQAGVVDLDKAKKSSRIEIFQDARTEALL